MQLGTTACAAAGGNGRPVGRGRHAVGAREARGERAQALQPDREADVGHRAVGVAQQRRRPLQAAGQQVHVGRDPERAPELPAEVGAREARRGRHVVDPQRIGVAGVGQVLGSEQVSGPGRVEHARRVSQRSARRGQRAAAPGQGTTGARAATDARRRAAARCPPRAGCPRWPWPGPRRCRGCGRTAGGLRMTPAGGCDGRRRSGGRSATARSARARCRPAPARSGRGRRW